MTHKLLIVRMILSKAKYHEVLAGLVFILIGQNKLDLTVCV